MRPVLLHFRDSLACHEGLGRRTFALEAKEESHDSSEQQLLVGRPTVHVFKSKLTSAEAWSKSASELWDAHARELIESALYSDDVKFLAVMSATRYAGAAPSDERPPRSHSELLSRVKGHAALGGGGLALFGSGCLYTWPGRLDQVQQRLRDRTEVDWRRFMDDSAYRYVALVIGGQSNPPLPFVAIGFGDIPIRKIGGGYFSTNPSLRTSRNSTAVVADLTVHPVQFRKKAVSKNGRSHDSFLPDTLGAPVSRRVWVPSCTSWATASASSTLTPASWPEASTTLTDISPSPTTTKRGVPSRRRSSSLPN